jgi:hypothetical protein
MGRDKFAATSSYLFSKHILESPLEPSVRLWKERMRDDGIFFDVNSDIIGFWRQASVVCSITLTRHASDRGLLQPSCVHVTPNKYPVPSLLFKPCTHSHLIKWLREILCLPGRTFHQKIDARNVNPTPEIWPNHPRRPRPSSCTRAGGSHYKMNGNIWRTKIFLLF